VTAVKTQYDKDFISATYTKWSTMKNNCAEKRSKDKKRIVRLAIPFSLTLDQFRTWCLSKFKHAGGTAKCEYCSRPVSILTFSPDHMQPLQRSGSSGTNNLAVSCSDCNEIKSDMSAEWFKYLLRCLWEMPDADAKSVRSRLLKSEKLASLTRRNTVRIQQFEREKAQANGRG
jgi:5-methylcytosine-specific restriction endonuclease McrA